MSAFVVIFDPSSNISVDPGVLDRVMEHLKQRGPDGRDVITGDYFAMGHWHFWTTPEEVGEKQPLRLEGLPFRIVFDGRLDNRKELLDGLDLNNLDDRRMSDSALVIRAYDHWGKDFLSHFIGEYALAIIDEARRELICARDSMGDRSLFYSFKGTRLVVASEPWAVAGGDNSTVELNEKAVAHYLALKANETGETLFKNVYELPPAHGIVFSEAEIQRWRYWRPNLSAKLRGKSDQEYAEGFLPILEESVRCRMRSAAPVGVLMSGGLDSCSVASLAARMLVPQPLSTLSYIFDELPDCDERHYIGAMQARWGIHSIQFPCDDLWPFKNLQALPRDPNGPNSNLYRMLIERTYQRARQEGLRVLLTGHYGDQLYDGDEDWLGDLITEGRLREAAQELKLHLRYTGMRRTWKSAYLRRAVLMILQTIPGGRKLLDQVLKQRRKHQWRTIPPWLTPFSAAQLSEGEPQPDPVVASRSNLLGSMTAEGCVNEIYYANRHGVELRYPYRDRRLVEYVLALPAYQLYFHGHYKHVLRTAMQGILPETIRRRNRPTTLLSLLARGQERDRIALQACVEDPGAAWRKYVRADWLLEHWSIPFTMENSGTQSLVPWLCLSFATWYHDGVDYE